MKKFFSLLLTAAMLFGMIAVFGSCGNDTYEIAMVTDVGLLRDGSFNEGTWNGVEAYAKANDITYKYYQPANGADATDEDRYNAFKAAIANGAKIVVAPGYMQEKALKRIAAENPTVNFIFIDGWPLTDDNNKVLSNVAAVAYQEEQCGYLAGYAAVKLGYTKLGFTGGGGGTNPAVNRYGYGYVQGAIAAAEELNVNVEMKYSFKYGASFSASTDLQTQITGWYNNGTEVVFSCGGAMCSSVFAAAAVGGDKTIGVDVDQSDDSNTVITSAMKGLKESVEIMLGKFYQNKWSECGGKLTTLGAKDNAVGLPETTKFVEGKFTMNDYKALFNKIVDGTITVKADYTDFMTQIDNGTYSNSRLTLIYEK